jgi:AraC-like DNA-binding protein
LRLDGVELDRPALVTHGLKSHRICQPSKLTIAAIFLRHGDSDRGWPEREAAARVHRIHASSLMWIRSVFSDALSLAVHDPARFGRDGVVSGMQQSLLGSIDHAFLVAPDARKSRLAVRRYVQICRLADEFMASRPRHAPSSFDVAGAAGVTIRTLHGAMVAVHGMALQRFIVLNRLWAARADLSNRAATDRVKTAAFDNGFWHLGRFARTYRTFFGEAPSQTIARAKSA